MAKRYQRVNQNPCNEEEQTTQWSNDTKGLIRIRVTKKSRQHNGQNIGSCFLAKVGLVIRFLFLGGCWTGD